MYKNQYTEYIVCTEYIDYNVIYRNRYISHQYTQMSFYGRRRNIK